MEAHKLLQRQLKKYLPNGPLHPADFNRFISAVNEAYQGYEKDIEFSSHAFSLSEKEYHHINEELKSEIDIRKISIKNLKDALHQVDSELETDTESDDLLRITEYVKDQIKKRQKIEVELKKNVKRINALIRNIQSGVLIENEERKIVFTNQSFCQLFNIPLNARLLIGEDCAESAEQTKHLFIHPESFLSRVDELLHNKKHVSGDVLELVDGRVLERDFVPIFIDGNYKGHLWNYTDITEKKRILDSLAMSESRNRLIMNSALDAIVSIDADCNIIFWNPQAAQLFGWEEAEVLEKNFLHLIVPNQYREAFEDAVISYIKSGEGPLLQKLIELKGLKRSGELFPIEFSITPVEQSGKIIFCAFIRDISERKKSQNSLKASEEKYRGIIANMNLGLLEVDNEEFIQQANQSFCDMSGYSMEELIGTNASRLFLQKEGLEKNPTKIPDRKNGLSDAYEISWHTKSGELRWWLVSGGPRYNEKNEIVGSIGIHLDITAQKETEHQLIIARKSAEQSSIAKEAFLANMSHEIRTPLNGIIGIIRELSKENLSPEQHRYIDSARKASKHLLSIINNILDFSKIEAGELKLEKNHFKLADVIFDVTQILGNQASEKGILIEKFVDPRLAEAFIGDAGRIRQILINLTGNSIKFSDKGPIRISCNLLESTNETQEFELRIKDSGIGMDESYLKKIFTKFHQEDVSSSRKYGGSGLGLVITKELIEVMNGKISLVSKKGIGTEVIVELTLPIGRVDKIEKKNLSSDIKAIRGKSILLVEDNEMNRLVAVNALVPFDLQITEAINGEQAVELVKLHTFDLILMDLQMPVMGGLEATHILRDELMLTTPIVALTANAFKNEIDKCLAAGMNGYVIKPFEESELIAAIGKALKTKQKTSVQKLRISAPEQKKNQNEYDLSKLKEMSRGNTEFVNKMLRLFTESIPESVSALENAYAHQDYDCIKKTAHKIKPSLDNLGINLYQEIRDLEKFDEAQNTSEQLTQLITKVVETLKSVNAAIQENEL